MCRLSTYALFPNQSHSFPDNAMALFGSIRAQNCSPRTRDLRWRIFPQQGRKDGSGLRPYWCCLLGRSSPARNSSRSTLTARWEERSRGAADARCWPGCYPVAVADAACDSGRPLGQPVYAGGDRRGGGGRTEAYEARGEQQRIVESDLQQARYEASLAERRYAACDPDNRLIAAQLEKSWGAALRRAGLADDLDAAWNAPGVTMRARQRLLRALVTDIIADVDEVAREVVLTIHWRGGQHSQLRVRKPKSGEHGCRTPEEALAVMRSMATRWSDEDIAASLNRMGMPTGQEETWTAHRVSSLW